jgi:hypothetical protein
MIQTRRNSHGRRERQKARIRHVRTQRRWLQPERLEERTLLAANPFHNGFWPEDVNNDLRVNAMDALHIINELNQSGSHELLAPGEVAPEMADVPFYTDVSADGTLSAVDALRVVNTINSGEGEIAPSDVVRYRLALTDLNGNPLTNNTVNVGQTFQVRGFVQDVRLKAAPDPGSTTSGNPTGVFAAYMDVLMTNANLATVRYGETQELRLDAARPGGVWGTGEVQLTYAGQQTGQIPFLASGNEDAAAIQSALESLSSVGVGNVQVTSLQGADFDGRYFIRFVRGLGEQDIAPMSVQGSGLLGSYQDVNDDDGDGDKTEFLSFNPVPQIVDNYISVNPATPDQEDALFRSSFVFFDPYLNGPSATEEPLETGQPDGSRQFGEVGAFINRFSLNSPPDYTPRLEYQVFSLDVRADESGFVQFSGNVAEQAKTLVFSLPGGGSSNTEVNPANIGFIDPAVLTIAAPINVVHDTSTVLEDSAATSIPVLANDTVNASAGGVAPLTLVAGGLSAVTPAGSATVSISGNNVNFTPASNFNGQVTFTYQVQDSATTPNTATGTVTVTVTAVNDPPVVTNDTAVVQEDAPDTVINVLGNDNAGPADEPQALTVSAVGAPDQGGTVQIGAGGANVVYRPRANFFGTEKFTYTARDSSGATTVGTVTVTVNAVNDAPDAVGDTFGGIQEDSNATVFNVLVNDNAGPLEPADTITVVGVTQGNQGGVVTFTATNVSYRPAANYFGSETFTYTIRDGGGLEDTATVSVTIVNTNDAPDAVNDALEVDEDSADNVLNVMGNDSPGPFEGQVDAIRVVAVTPAGHGIVTVGNGGANLVYTPDALYFGSDTFTYTIRDNSGLEDTATVTVDVVPVVRPRARADAFVVPEDATAATAPALDVLINDLPNLEPAGTKVTLKSFTQPAHGVVQLLDNATPQDLTDDKLQYIPNANYSGNDSFTYTINDTAATGVDSVATAAIQVTPVNDPPTLNPIPNPTAIQEDAAQQMVNLTGITAGPLETQMLQVTAVSSNPGLIPNPAVAYTSPNATGTLTYTPVADQSGAAIVTVTVKDAGLDGNLGTADDGMVSQSFTVTVTAVNDAPTIKVPAQVSTKQDVDFTFAAGTASEISADDIDSAQLTVALVLQPDPLSPAVDPGNLVLGTMQGVTITGGGNNSNAVTFSGPLAAVNAALNGLKYDVTLGYEGSPSLTISANDGEFSPTATVGIIVSGINDPPVNALPPGPVQVAEDNDLFFNGNLQVSDPDAGLSTVEVTLSATNGALTPVANPNVVATPMGPGSVKLTGSMANINAALNGLKFRPNQDYHGPAQLIISTNDKGNTGDPPAAGQTELIDADTLAITVNPVNDPPVANDDGSATDRTTVLWNTTDNAFDVLVNDNTGPDVGETLTITNVDTSNAHGTATFQNGRLLYTPTPGYTGDAEIVYTVNDRTDGSGLTDTATVYVTVVDFVASNVSGYVYFDADDDGIKDPGEWGIGGVTISLTGTNIQGDAVNLMTWTDADGMYQFSNVLPSNTGTKYTLTEFHPAALVDGKDTAGDQGAEMSANDQMKIELPLFGYGAGILGIGNNFGELGFRSDVATGLGLHDLVHSGSSGGALLFGMDTAGNVTWFMNLGGWQGYAPGRPSATNPGGFNAAFQNDKLPLTDRVTGTVREVDATDSAIRSVYNRSGGWALGVFGDADDFGLPMHLAAAGGEGEGSSPTEGEDSELLVNAGSSGDYESAVDAVLAGIA